MPWKPEIKVRDKWYSNSSVFATQKEAENSAQDLYYRWTEAVGWRANESDDEPNYTYNDGRLTPIDTASAGDPSPTPTQTGDSKTDLKDDNDDKRPEQIEQLD
jgi:hypothetical protein